MRIMMRRVATWARARLVSFRASLISISDPNLGRLFGWSPPSYAGVDVTEASVLGLSAVYRALDLISGTLGQLRLQTVRETAGGRYMRGKSFLDNPGGVVGLNPVVWKRLVFVHLCLYNEAFLKHVYGGAGQLLGLQPLHPQSVRVTWGRPGDAVQPVGGKWYDATMIDGSTERHDARTMTQPMCMTLDGLRGLWITSVGRDSLGTAIAGDRAAAKMLSSGGSVAGIVSPADDEATWDDSAQIKSEVNDTMSGWENAGAIAVTNRRLKFTQVSLSAVDAQMLESRQFSIEDVARWFGVPPFELMQTDKQTSWGTGIESQQRGLGRQTLAPKASCLEAALSPLLSPPMLALFDFTDLERPSPDRVAEQAIQQWDAGLITLNETRAACGHDPIEGGDVLKTDAVSRETAPSDPAAVPGA